MKKLFVYMATILVVAGCRCSNDSEKGTANHSVGTQDHVMLMGTGSENESWTPNMEERQTDIQVAEDKDYKAEEEALVKKFLGNSFKEYDAKRETYSNGSEKWYFCIDWQMCVHLPEGFKAAELSEYVMTHHGADISDAEGKIHIYVSAYYDVIEEDILQKILEEHKADPKDFYIDKFINHVWYQMRVVYDDSEKERFKRIKPLLECFPYGPMGVEPNVD